MGEVKPSSKENRTCHLCDTVCAPLVCRPYYFIVCTASKCATEQLYMTLVYALNYLNHDSLLAVCSECMDMARVHAYATELDGGNPSPHCAWLWYMYHVALSEL